MSFRVILIFALAMTSLILFTNAEQMFFFEQSHPASSNISSHNSSLKEYSNVTVVGPNRYAETMALGVSSSRATSTLDAILSDTSCVKAYETNKGVFNAEPFISLNAESPLTPASTNKLITAAAVLTTLDPTSTLDTSLLAAKKGSTLSKAYIRTSGDPSFVTNTTPPSRRKTFLSPTHTHTFDDFASATYKAGVRNITSLVIDNTWLDLDAIEPGWSDDKNDVGTIAALNADEGFEGAALAANPNDHAAAVLKAAFAAKGITIDSISFGAMPNALSNDSVISSTSSASIKDLVSDTLKTSNNVYAEQLLMAAAHVKSGTVNIQSRKDFVMNSLKELNINTDGYVFVNGSGYSDDAKATCTMESDVIAKMNSLGIDLAQLSSHAGHDGTLTERFTSLDEDLYAKTGTLDGVTALTGSLGSNLSFSFISNGSFSDAQGKSLQEKVVGTLSSFPFVSAPVFSATFGS